MEQCLHLDSYALSHCGGLGSDAPKNLDGISEALDAFREDWAEVERSINPSDASAGGEVPGQEQAYDIPVELLKRLCRDVTWIQVMLTGSTICLVTGAANELWSLAESQGVAPYGDSGREAEEEMAEQA